jgi:hypothetical protein
MSVAKSLTTGCILAGRRCHAGGQMSPDYRIGAVFAGTNAVSERYIRLTQAAAPGRDKILSSMPQLLTEPAGIYARSIRGAGENMQTIVTQAWRIHCRSAIRTHEVMDKRSYPWDVVS